MKPANLSSVAVFVVVVLFVIGAWTWAHFDAARRAGESVAKARSRTLRFLGGLVLWLALFCGVGVSGLVETRPIPFVPLLFVSMALVSILYALRSSSSALIAAQLPLAALVGFQAFRLPLELVLHSWAEQGTIPNSMTWTGSNVDIISGAVALALAPFASRRGVAWVANGIGMVLLFNVARVALFSSPVPFGWDVEPKLLLVGSFPYALIAPVCVGGAMAGHVLLTRRLLAPVADLAPPLEKQAAARH